MQSGTEAHRYEATLLALLELGVDLHASTRSAALAAALGRTDARLAASLLAFASQFDIPIVLRAIELLDTPRRLARLRAKLTEARTAQAARVSRLAECARVPTGGDTDEKAVLAAVDAALGTGVGRLAKRMRTVDSLRKLTASKRNAAVTKSKKLNAKALKKQLKEDTAAAVERKPRVAKPEVLPAVRRKTLAGAVRRAQAGRRTVAALAVEMSNLQQTLADAGLTGDSAASFHTALSGACAKRIRRWLRAIPAEKLESFIVTDQPKATWARLADLVHPAPGDCALASFLPWVFADSDAKLHELAAACPVVARHVAVTEALQSENAARAALAAGLVIDFSLLRRRLPAMTLTGGALATMISGQGVSVKQLIWFYGDGLEGPAVRAAIVARLAAGEPHGLTFGKLVERMLLLKKEAASAARGQVCEHREMMLAALACAAEAQLATLQLELPGPVLVLGDASYSMQARSPPPCHLSLLYEWPPGLVALLIFPSRVFSLFLHVCLTL